MAEQPKRRIIRGAHRGGMTDWAMVEFGAALMRKLRAERDRKNRKAEPVRPPIIDQIARARAEG